tara:strand:+ start:117 stop:572 length:456 start_codon:yes stop_codon:yes gene_type:complete
MITYAKHDEEFYGIFKLINGEEVLGKSVLTTEKDESLVFIQDPVSIQVIEKNMGENKLMRGIGFHKWMQLSDEEFFILREKDIVAVASMSKEVILMYETFLSTDGGLETNEEKVKRQQRRRADIKEVPGYLGKVNEARAVFERLYKEPNNP